MRMPTKANNYLLDSLEKNWADFFNFPAPRFNTQSPEMPAMDIAETDTGYAVSVDLAGVKKEDVNVKFENGILSISGEKKEQHTEENATCILKESSYGKFERSVKLPKNTDADTISAELKDGVLSVKIAKSPEAAPKQIEIN